MDKINSITGILYLAKIVAPTNSTTQPPKSASYAQPTALLVSLTRLPKGQSADLVVTLGF